MSFICVFCTTNLAKRLPHWNWTKGQKIAVHIYFNNADEVELFLNGKSLGIKRKQGDDLFVRFNGVTYLPGTLKAISKRGERKVAQTVVKTAGAPYRIVAEVEEDTIIANGQDLGFIKVSIVDKEGTIVPSANNTLHFQVEGMARIEALDNGSQIDLEPYYNKKYRNAFNGRALAIVRSATKAGTFNLKIKADGLGETIVKVNTVPGK